MIWAYALIIAAITALYITGRKKGKIRLNELSVTEHPLRIIYPCAEGVLWIAGFLPGTVYNSNVSVLLKSLYVKENVEKERYIYQVKKTACSLAIIMVSCILGTSVSLMNTRSEYISSLERGDPGESPVSHALETRYRDISETVDIVVEPVCYTEEEILGLFERSYDDILELVLADNKSQDEVSSPLNLISEYKGFQIFWECEDPSLISYNGEIKGIIGFGEKRPVNLYGEFSLGDTKAIYTFPIQVTGRSLSPEEKLEKDISEKISEENDVHDKEVKLPEDIGGYSIWFSAPRENNEIIFLITAIVFSFLAFIFYDKKLEKQIEKRQEQMMSDFTEIVSKLSLLYDAGLSIHGAFERVVSDYERMIIYKQDNGKDNGWHYAYKEMKLALEKIKNGESEAQAYAAFGKRCRLQPFIKLGNLLEQNLNKGTKGMQDILKKEVEEAFEARTRSARKKGEEAGTKMLIPMILMLMVVIAIVAVPALMRMSAG